MRKGHAEMLRRLYSRTIRLAGHRHALAALAVIAFLESSVFPIPPDLLMIPMILARPARAFTIAAVATAASVLGGLAGYAIGWGLYESLGRAILDLYGAQDEFARFAESYNRWGAWAVLIAGTTPFPYKIITILSGSTGLDLGVFVLSSVVARGLRFFVLAVLLWKFGPPIRDFIERRLGLVFGLFMVLLVGGFVVARSL